MPQNVRNFWIEATIEGRETQIVGGPLRRNGGMKILLKQRDRGRITTALEIYCIAGLEEDGRETLTTQVWERDGKAPICEVLTER